MTGTRRPARGQVARARIASAASPIVTRPNVLQSAASTSGRKLDSTRPIADGRCRGPTRSYHNELEALPEDQPEHVARLRAERHANADLTRPQPRAERDDAVHADHRQHQTEDAHARWLESRRF